MSESRKGSDHKRFSVKARLAKEKLQQKAAKAARKSKQADLVAGHKLKRDPGVPNIERFKRALDSKFENEEKRQQASKAARDQAVARKRKATTGAATEPTGDKDEKDITQIKKIKPEDLAKRRWYWREMNKVIDAADVILEVLDARDPIGCRCPEIERLVISKKQVNGSGRKQVVLLLNKIDLVPPEVVLKWVKYFRREYPCLAFKAATSKGGHIGQSKLKTTNARDKVALSTAVGATQLLSLLKNYARQEGIKKKKKITVGIIGYPNVGKSSIINSLKRERAVGVSSQPGFTKALQQVHLDSDIDLVDSPGVLFSAGAPDEDLVLRNCIKLEQISDPLAAVSAVLKRCSQEKLCQIYGIGPFQNVDQFLARVGLARGKLTKGGVPNLELTARGVLKDWNEGKIPFYSLPPVVDDLEAPVIVDGFSKEFDIDALLKDTMVSLKETSMDTDIDPSHAMVVQSTAPLKLDVATYMDEDSSSESKSAPAPFSLQGGDSAGADIFRSLGLQLPNQPFPSSSSSLSASPQVASMDDVHLPGKKAPAPAPVKVQKPVINMNELQRNKVIKEQQKALKKKQGSSKAGADSAPADMEDGEDMFGFGASLSSEVPPANRTETGAFDFGF